MADGDDAARLLNTYRDEIRARSPKSLSIWQQNRTVMPAGVGSVFRLADPFPMVVKRAKGARIWDADDNEYLDFMLGFSVMILGNAPEEVEDAIREALPRGTHYGLCHEHEYAFAKLFCDMVHKPTEVARLIARWGREGLARLVVSNLKLPMKKRVPVVAEARRIVQAGGWKDLRTRQLYHDRDEITLFAHA